VRDELREERAAEQRAAHRPDLVRAERRGERADEGLHPPRLREQRVEVEPEPAVVSGLKPEVSVPALDQPEE
jgi:hypothetical protein